MCKSSYIICVISIEDSQKDGKKGVQRPLSKAIIMCIVKQKIHPVEALWKLVPT